MAEKKKYYNPKYKERVYEYKKRSIKRVPFDVHITFYNDVLKPAADALGDPINTFIKDAIQEKIERMKDDGIFF